MFGVEVLDAPVQSARSNTDIQPPSSPATPKAEENELSIPGGEITLGGADTGYPLRRVIVDSFNVSETEVTNLQYADFVKETNHRIPQWWSKSEYPAGTASEPVTNVSWQDAVDYCAWLGQKTGMIVRLPTEAEWEFAARGSESRKYPWGDHWDNRAVASRDNGGHLRAVKSYPRGRSPFGAYDMVGNVWEWTSEPASENKGLAFTSHVGEMRVLKGGAADEPAELLSVASRKVVPSDFQSQSIGFRCIVRTH